jgi:hypothetical protein
MQLYRLGMVALLAALPIALVACGGDDDSGAKDNGSATSSTGASSSATLAATKSGSTGSTATKSSGGGSSGDAANLKDLIEKSKSQTYQITYTATDSDGESSWIVAQKSGKTYTSINQKGGENAGLTVLIDDGKSSYICQKDADNPDGGCFKTASSADDENSPNADDGFDDTNVKEIAGKKIAGRDARCFQSQDADNPGTSCVDKSTGAFLAGDSPDLKVTATNYSTSVDDKVFTPPYKVMSLDDFGGFGATATATR